MYRFVARRPEHPNASLVVFQRLDGINNNGYGTRTKAPKLHTSVTQLLHRHHTPIILDQLITQGEFLQPPFASP
jgi:hypothetical protein